MSELRLLAHRLSLRHGTSVRRRESSSVDRRARESPRGSGRRGSPRAGAPRARSRRADERQIDAARHRRAEIAVGRAARARRAARRRRGVDGVGRGPSRVADQAGACATSGRGTSAPARQAPSRLRRGHRSRSTRRRSQLRRAPRRVCIAAAARAPNTSPSSSELLARRLAPWTPVQATSPAANSPGIDVRPVEVGVDAAHDVVRGRADRKRIASRGRGRRVAQHRAMVGNRARTYAASRCASVRYTGAPGSQLLADDGARDDVARREIAGGVVARP